MTRSARGLALTLLAATAAASLGACQQFPRFAFAHRVRPIPVMTASGKPQSLEDRLYAKAAAAIERREYDTALDALQLARSTNPNDPRVLNALGVVYDKLGRFDLSARYYDLAERADPGSKVVAMNRSYSLMLQNAVRTPNGATALASVAAPATVATAAPVQASLPTAPTGPFVSAVAVSAQDPSMRAAAIPVSLRSPAVSEDELYRRAAALIQRKSYGEALRDLQTARALKPNDPRVLCALGVVYDWLGRFDLSKHYYDLAEAADPGSVVVAINRQYSEILQHHGGAIVADNVVMTHDVAQTGKAGKAVRPAPHGAMARRGDVGGGARAG